MLELLKSKISEKTEKIVVTTKDYLENNNFKVPDDIRERRLEICSSCDKLHKKSKLCTLCGCHIPSKTYIANTSCPMKKWEKYNK